MRDDCAELSNRLSNLLGQIAHRRKDYAGALEHYGRAA
jgi:tetratricopeptide (TPR) repeat protein